MRKLKNLYDIVVDIGIKLHRSEPSSSRADAAASLITELKASLSHSEQVVWILRLKRFKKHDVSHNRLIIHGHIL